jgi:hypothetical protein
VQDRHAMDVFPNEHNFYSDKSRQTFHHNLKEHYKISDILKFRCKMLKNADNIAMRSMPFFSHFVLCTGNWYHFLKKGINFPCIIQND